MWIGVGDPGPILSSMRWEVSLSLLICAPQGNRSFMWEVPICRSSWLLSPRSVEVGCRDGWCVLFFMPRYPATHGFHLTFHSSVFTAIQPAFQVSCWRITIWWQIRWGRSCCLLIWLVRVRIFQGWLWLIGILATRDRIFSLVICHAIILRRSISEHLRFSFRTTFWLWQDLLSFLVWACRFDSFSLFGTGSLLPLRRRPSEAICFSSYFSSASIFMSRLRVVDWRSPTAWLEVWGPRIPWWCWVPWQVLCWLGWTGCWLIGI